MEQIFLQLSIQYFELNQSIQFWLKSARRKNGIGPHVGRPKNSFPGSKTAQYSSWFLSKWEERYCTVWKLFNVYQRVMTRLLLTQQTFNWSDETTNICNYYQSKFWRQSSKVCNVYLRTFFWPYWIVGAKAKQTQITSVCSENNILSKLLLKNHGLQICFAKNFDSMEQNVCSIKIVQNRFLTPIFHKTLFQWERCRFFVLTWNSWYLKSTSSYTKSASV